MKKLSLIVSVLSLFAAALVYAKISANADDFKPADDFPREALFYAQIRDLPALAALWNESELRRKYLESANYKEFRNNHLALKLAARASEIEAELGIFPDLGFASSLGESSAAFAVYDVGRTEFVFIAPMSEEKILASALFKIQTSFEEISLDDETVVYSKQIEVDNGRQRQKILFANFRGRLILATSEKLFLQTLDNIKGKTPKNRLSAEPFFRRVAEKIKPNAATVWLDQKKLNEDYYFRRYWLMSEIESLENIRAGMIDFEIRDEKIIEKRAFLTTENSAAPSIDAETARRLAALIPENAPFYKIEKAGKIPLDATIFDVLFDAGKTSARTKPAESRKDYYFRDWEKSYSYTYLEDDFSEQVDDAGEPETLSESADKITNDRLSQIIDDANPRAGVRLFSPRMLAPPLFFDNRKALILALENSSRLNPILLENALAETARKRLTVNVQKADFAWSDFSSGDFTARRLTLPSLGWSIFYARRENDFVFSGSEELLAEILSAEKNRAESVEAFESLTVIDLKHGRASFDAVSGALETDGNYSALPGNTGFFTGNIASLLDAAAKVEKIEIRRTSEPNFLFEEIELDLKD